MAITAGIQFAISSLMSSPIFLDRTTREKFGLGMRLGMLVFVVYKSAQHNSVN